MESGCEDRISSLPNTVLGHVLSYLTTVESVRTSILSKRWLSVWSHVPVLLLDDSSLYRPDPNIDQALHSTFTRFLNNVFNKADSLLKLTLKCSKFDCYRVNDWVMAAMKHRVRELNLSVSMNICFKLGVPLFAYQYLLALKIGKKFDLEIPGEVLLPCLKRLHLDSIQFPNDESCLKLLSGCPVLEDFHMETCGMQYVKTLWIVSPSLKLLVIEYRDGVYPAMKHEYQVVVDTPKLEVLRYQCNMAKGYSFKNLDSLTDAYIDVDIKHWDRNKTTDIKRTAFELVNGISNAKMIAFIGKSQEVLYFVDRTTFPMFNEVTKLVLEGDVWCSAQFDKFLHNSPFLQVLVLDKVRIPLSFIRWFEPEQIPKCLLDNIKSVEIWGFNGQIHLLKLINYLLSYGKVLEELSVGSNKEQHKELKVSDDFLSFLLGKNLSS